MSKKKETINIESLINVLVKDFERYKHIKQFGCDDPFHPDGVNLNLKRNHIIYDKKQIDQYCKENNCSFPSEYNDIQTPERVPDEFIAGAEEIRTNAIKVKNVLKPLYEKLVETGRSLSPNQKDRICYNAVIRYYTKDVIVGNNGVTAYFDRNMDGDYITIHDDIVTLRNGNKIMSFYSHKNESAYNRMFESIDCSKAEYKDGFYEYELLREKMLAALLFVIGVKYDDKNIPFCYYN